MKTVIVLAMHGAPPSDFPKPELAEFMRLHAQLDHGDRTPPYELVRGRHEELDRRVRRWPRTEANDPFYAGSMKLAAELEQATRLKVFAGFNEFCAPSLDEAFDEGVRSGAAKVIVVTPMMTRGGEHAERDIPAAIERARRRHPAIEFVYAWPFPPADTAQFLADHARIFIDRA